MSSLLNLRTEQQEKKWIENKSQINEVHEIIKRLINWLLLNEHQGEGFFCHLTNPINRPQISLSNLKLCVWIQNDNDEKILNKATTITATLATDSFNIDLVDRITSHSIEIHCSTINVTKNPNSFWYNRIDKKLYIYM